MWRIIFLTFTLISLAYACPNGTILSPHGSYCYKFMDKPSTWYWAEEICSSLDGHLVSIHDAFTNIFLSQIVNSTRNIWIGGTTNVLNATWSWSDNSSWSGYTNWNSNFLFY